MTPLLCRDCAVKASFGLLLLGILTSTHVVMSSPVIGRPNPNAQACSQFSLVSREQWNAIAPKEVNILSRLPAPYVVIHHTYIPDVCNSSAECELRMREMQQFHLGKGWNDIGYNFLIGGDNRVYQGRGWGIVGAHAPKYNFISVGIAFIGNFMEALPQESMVSSMRSLIQCGINEGYIATDYKLVGHRQVRDTQCPGDRLFKEIQNWNNYAAITDIQPAPTSPKTSSSSSTTTSTTSTTAPTRETST